MSAPTAHLADQAEAQVDEDDGDRRLGDLADGDAEAAAPFADRNRVQAVAPRPFEALVVRPVEVDAARHDRRIDRDAQGISWKPWPVAAHGRTLRGRTGGKTRQPAPEASGIRSGGRG